MTISNSSDTPQKPSGPPPAGGLLSSEQQLLAGIRVRPAEFARMMNCSRQAVSQWVHDGRITLGADGRFDPCRAVSDLLRTGDPKKLRVMALRPLLDELADNRRRIAMLEADLAKALSENATLRESSEFFEGSSNELLEVIAALTGHLERRWFDLAALPDGKGLGVVLDWLRNATEYTPAGVGFMLPTDADGQAGGDTAPDWVDIEWLNNQMAELDQLIVTETAKIEKIKVAK